MSTTGHELEAVNIQGMKASLKKGGNKGLYNEAICSTASATAAKVTNTTPPSFSLVSGAKILVKFTYAIAAENATLQVGDTAAKPIYYHGAALLSNIVKAGTLLFLQYDGTSYNIVGDIDSVYESKTAASGGSDLSLVTTGEKYDWNNKPNKSEVVSNVSFNSSTGKLQETINETTMDVCDVVTSGFRITQDDTNGIDTFTAVGQATITEDNTNGIDNFNF